jgi:hypothetical protein
MPYLFYYRMKFPFQCPLYAYFPRFATQISQDKVSPILYA